MGINTTFRGRFRLDHELTSAHAAYLRNFARMRHMQRAIETLEDRCDPFREAVGLPLEEGAYFTGSDAHGTSRNDPSVIDANQPPAGQPGLWCQWTPSPDGMGLEWDREEKFHAFEEWLHYLVDHFLKPWGYHLSGAVEWENPEGERGSLHALANRIRARALPPLGAEERRTRILRSVEGLEEERAAARRLDLLHDLASERRIAPVADHWERLMPMLEDENPTFQQALCELLRRIVSQLRLVEDPSKSRIAELTSVVPHLLALEPTAEPELRRSIVALLGPFALRSTEAAELLIRTLGSSDRMAAAFAARSLGQHGADAIPLLLGALESEDEGIRCHAAEAFTWMGKPAGPALPFLRARLDSTHSERERRQLENVLERLSRQI